MTIPVEQIRYVYEGPYTSGETVPIPFSYRETLHVKAAIASRTLTFNVDYSVLGQNLTLLINIPAGEKIVVYRQTPLENEAEFPQEAEFDSAKINDSFDKLTMIVQEQQDALSRAIQVPTIVTPDSLDTFTPVPEAGKSLKWDPTGTFLINTTFDLDSIAGQAVEQALIATEQANRAAQSAADTAAIVANAYTKAETNDLLADKQDAFVIGQHLSLSGGILSVALDTIMTGYTEDAWNALSAEEQAAIPLALIYE